MIRFKYILLFIFSLLCLHPLSAQVESNYPQDYFRSPVEGRIYLSGTFAELRSNHFHGGIDIKTGGVEGKNIYAAADGWVTRVKISPWGYGNALYIEHPNGYTTVYGHLQEIKGEVAKYIRSQQYQQQSFSVDLYLKAGQFPVKKGDIIALSGNSGGSGGPHLHFEIRETANQEPINPLLFGIEVKDYITPIINSIRIYPAEENTHINGSTSATTYKLNGWGDHYRLKDKDTLSISGDFYLGINTIDKQNDTQNKNGIFQIEVYVDSTLYYSHKVERINFSSTRYLNTLIDFDFYKKESRRYQRTYQSPNNLLPIYHEVKNKGIFSFNDDDFHLIQYIVKDANANTSVLSFTVFTKDADPALDKGETELLNPLQDNRYENSEISVYFPLRSLYDTMTFTSQIKENKKSLNGLVYEIGRIGVGLQKHLHIRLKDLDIDPEIKDKIYIGELYKNQISAYSIKWVNDDLSFKTRDFGQYLILVDTIAPNIRLKSDLKNNPSPEELKFIITDGESGISKYDAWLNGSWILLEWDPKKSTMSSKLQYIKSNNNIFRIKISDAVGNTQEKVIQF